MGYRPRKTRGRNFISQNYGIIIDYTQPSESTALADTGEIEPLRSAAIRYDAVSGFSVAPKDAIVQNGVIVDMRPQMGTNDPGRLLVYEDMGLVLYDPSKGRQSRPSGDV